MSDPVGSIAIDWAGEAWQLRGDRTLFRPGRSTLYVADVHLGKAATFRAAGIPAPEATTRADLDRLATALAESAARRLVVLGDLLHAAAGVVDPMRSTVAAWRRDRPELEVSLVVGNHDSRAGAVPSEWRFAEVGPRLDDAGILCVHDPVAGTAPYLAGHLHPAVAVGDRDGFRRRMPAFILGGGSLLLPAFTAFAGGATTRLAEGERAFAADGRAVLEVTPLVAGRSARSG